MILYVDKTLDEEDGLMIFDDLKVQNSHLKISLLERLLLHNISLSRSGTQQVSRLRYMKQTTIRMRAMTKRKNSYSFSFLVLELKLSTVTSTKNYQ